MPRPRVLTAALLTLTGALVVAAAPPAGAADLPVSQSRGFFLSGAVGGTDFSTVAGLAAAQATNLDGGAAVVSANPLTAQVLGQSVPIGQQTVPVGAGLTFGAVNQFALANGDGSAVASSGAVSDNGAIQTPAAAGTAGDMSLDLQTLAASSGLSTDQIADLGNVTLRAGALAGTATRASFGLDGSLGAAGGTYQIGSLGLTIQGPAALTDLFTTLTDSLDGLDDAVNDALDALDLVPGQVLDFSVTLPESSTLLSELTTVSGPGFSADLVDGTLTIDLAALIAATGTDINALPPNTDLLPYVINGLPVIARAVASALTTQLEAGATAFQDALAATSVTATLAGASFPLSGSTLADLLPANGLAALTDPLDTALGTLTTGLSSGLGSGLGQLGSALGQLLQLVANAQSTATDGTFTESALRLAVLPSMGSALPTALELSLGNASVGPGAPIVVASTPPSPQSSVPMLANTGPVATMGSLALGTWAVVAGFGLLLTAGAVRRSRLLHVGSHRH